MTRLSLSDDVGSVVGAGLRLTDDVGVHTTVDVSPVVTIWQRTVTGVDDNGDSIFGWEVFAEDVPVAMWETRREVSPELIVIKVKAMLLYPDEDLNSTMAMTFGYRDVDTPETLDLWRITELYQNGVRTEVEGERVADSG